MSKKKHSKEYKTNEITVIWKPDVCIHAALCVQQLPEVYRPGERPWIAIENAKTEMLIEQIKTCPSGALSFRLNKKTDYLNQKHKTMENSKVAAKIPIMVELETGKKYAWCACGHSANQPWCDGSHKGTGITPVIFSGDKNRKAALCMCKQTGNRPYCDGAHAKID